MKFALFILPTIPGTWRLKLFAKHVIPEFGDCD